MSEHYDVLILTGAGVATRNDGTLPDVSARLVRSDHRLSGHAGLHVVDGLTVSVNLGVNPSLTITAQAERAMAMWPNTGDDDVRPPLGSTYEPVAAITPRHPVVPEAAPGALRLPVLPTARATL